VDESSKGKGRGYGSRAHVLSGLPRGDHRVSARASFRFLRLQGHVQAREQTAAGPYCGSNILGDASNSST